MRTDQEAQLSRLLDLAEEFGSAGIDQWQAERRTAIADRQKQAQQFVVDNPVRFGLKRMQQGTAPYAGKLVSVLKPVEFTWVTYQTLPVFAKSIGVNLDDLTSMLDGKRLEVTGKNGQVWRSDSSPRWSASKQFIDTSRIDEFREEMAKEDRETETIVGRQNNYISNLTTSVAEATYKEFKA